MTLQSLIKSLSIHLRRLTSAGRNLAVQRRQRNLRLGETLALGEKRFLAVVFVENRKFLVGGAANSLSLLAELGRDETPHTQQVSRNGVVQFVN